MRNPVARWALVFLLASSAAFGAELFNEMGFLNTNITSTSEDDRAAKSFTIGVDSRVDAFEIRAQGVTGQGLARVRMELREDSNGVPGALIAIGQGDAGFSGSTATFVALTPSNVFLDAGVKYWAVAYAVGGDWVAWKHHSTATEPSLESGDGGGGWTTVNGRKLTLRVLGTFENAPVAVDDLYEALEGQNQFGPVLANDMAPASVGIKVSDPAVLMQQTGHFSLSVGQDFSGQYTFSYVLDAGGLSSNSATVRVILAEVNDRPRFTAGDDVTVFEDAPTVAEPWAVGITAGEQNQGLQFETVAVSKPELFDETPALTPYGVLTFKVAPDVSGLSYVSVQLVDDGGTANGGVDTSVVRTFRIFVDQTNDAPTYKPGEDRVTSNDAGEVVVIRWASELSPGNLDPAQRLSFITATSDAGELFDDAPRVTTQGDLIYTPKFGAIGTAETSVMMVDDAKDTAGVPLSSPVHTLRIELKDGPPIVIIPPVVVPDAGQPEAIPQPKPPTRGHYACAVTPDFGVLLLLPALGLLLRRRRFIRHSDEPTDSPKRTC